MRLDTDTSSATTPPTLDTRDLEAHSKKKIVSSFDCNGTILDKNDVSSAVSKMKGAKDMTVGSYLHELKNGEKTSSGTSKKLREFPIIERGTFNGAGPGSFCAVTDYNHAFVGVMWEKAIGAKMTKCTPVAETTTAAPKQTNAAKKDEKKASKAGNAGKAH